MKKNFFKKEKGASLLLVIFIVGIILAMSLGISRFITRQIQMLRGTGNAVKSFYIADSGIEKFLFDKIIPPGTVPLLEGYYQLSCECKAGGNCPAGCPPASLSCQAANFCLKATGNYSNFLQIVSIDY